MFTVIELQTTGEQTGVLTYTYANRNEAESKFHDVLRAAAVSTLDYHSAILLDAECYPQKRDSYKHLVEDEETIDVHEHI